MATGMCPKCGISVTHAIIEEIEARVLAGPSWLAVNYLCPHCHIVLSVGIDPVALKTDTVKEVLEGLGKTVP